LTNKRSFYRRAAMPASAAGPATRDLILDAAERHFAERGFAGVSMRELAADAGLRNQASLYNYFRHKQALYEAVLARGIDAVVAVVAASGRAGAREGGAASARGSEAFVDLLFDYLVAHPNLPHLLQRAALDDPRHLRKTLARLLRPLYEQGMGVLARTGGAWQAAELPHLAAGLYQLIFGYFASAKLLAAVADGDPLSPAALGRQRRFVKAAVARLLSGGGAPAHARRVSGRAAATAARALAPRRRRVGTAPR
jgi:AcrR family transcriptional regulator